MAGPIWTPLIPASFPSEKVASFGQDAAPEPKVRVDNAMVKALARVFRWRKMLDDGSHATIEDLATSKGIAKTYACQILRLTLPSPEIVEAILDGRQPAELQLHHLLDGLPLEWEDQRLGLNELPFSCQETASGPECRPRRGEASIQL